METIVGIDLGTTNSEIAIIQDGKPVVLEENGSCMLPSVIGLDSSGQMLIGQPARNQAAALPDRTIKSIKRKMGRDITVELGDQSFTPQEVSAIILRSLKQRAETAIDGPVSKAVITVPAYFDDNQRQATKAAGELAGLEVVRIINEPTAAALTYSPNSTEQETLLVYDLGGGTFDVSIVRVERGVVEVLASHGDTQLGGDDVDRAILDHVCDTFKKKKRVDLRHDRVSRARVLNAVETAKKELSSEVSVKIQEEFIAERKGVAQHLDMVLERSGVDELVFPLLEKTLHCVDRALEDANLTADEIDKVVLVGGATRMPLVRDLLEGRLQKDVHTEVEPDLCVAMGAAIQAGLINGMDLGAVLVDVTPHTLGVDTVRSDRMGNILQTDVFVPMIRRNTPLPATFTKEFSTVHAGQEGVIVPILQGESPCSLDNSKIGEIELEGMRDGDDVNRFFTRFDLDLNGMLKVVLTERGTGNTEDIVIQSALRKFASDHMEDAKGRLNEVLPENLRDDEDDASTDDDIPQELREIVTKGREVIANAERLAEASGEEDLADLGELVARFEQAIEDKAEDALKEVVAEIEELLFYLDDQ